MKLHVISTINGLENEGMRNIATHLCAEFEKSHTLTYSSLKDVFSIIKNGRKSDFTLVFARLIKPVYYMLRLVRPFIKKICVVCVQPVSEDFATLNKKHNVADFCLALCKDDAFNAFDSDIIKTFDVGINTDKFSKASQSREELCEKWNLPTDKTIVLHVGHCSKGRYLEDMLALDKNKYHCVVIASGMFNDDETIKALSDGGVDLRFSYLKNIEEIYSCADVYFFPTKSSEFVISVPLSVMEALSCGTPVVAYKSFDKLSFIKTKSEDAFALIDSKDELEVAVRKALAHKASDSYLKNPQSWSDVATQVMKIVKTNLE